ncbi:MAG: O-antigen ligase family protein [Anaerolineae bacterium]|nr:O-antigen ligase family protein [Anaerolineae bacterium]
MLYLTNPLQDWIARLDRRAYALLIGTALGVLGGVTGLLIAVFDPLIAFGLIVGVMLGLYVITNVNAALYGVIAVMALVPFATFPVKIVFTPTFMDAVMGAFFLVYAFQWMTGKRHFFRLTPVHGAILLYLLWLIISFVLGLRYAMPTPAIARQFAETLLSISMVFVLVDLLREPAALRRLVLAVMIAVGAQAIVALILYAMNDAVAERTLVRLARFGYPNGGVIRYIEDNPADAERAIGTWVDPNALGGFLAVAATMIAPQVFARRPVLRSRWIAWGVLGIVGLALVLTLSRASLLAFAIGLLFIGQVKGYRRFITLIALGGTLVLILPQTQAYVGHFINAFTAGDISTQMRIGEYTDAFRLIRRYPFTGVGFTGTPDNDIYTDVASMYLIMANQIGLIGVGLFALTLGSVFAYGRRAWQYVRDNPELRSIHLGYHAALLTALINATADLYFFRLDFQASITLFWLVVALALASSRLAIEAGEQQTPPTLRTTPQI